jgi:hypothetical protein
MKTILVFMKAKFSKENDTEWAFLNRLILPWSIQVNGIWAKDVEK